MISRLVLLFWLTAAALHADPLPVIPPSDRAVSPEEVKNFWLNSIAAQPLPPQATGLYPEKQRARERLIENRRSRLRAIRAGEFDTAALLASLTHNVGALRERGETAEADATEARLFRLREHLAKLATLEAERRAAEKMAAAFDRISFLDAEISALR